MQKPKRYSLNFYRLNSANFVNANLIRVLFTLLTLVLHLGICLSKVFNHLLYFCQKKYHISKILEIASLSVFFKRRSSLIFLQNGNIISVGEKYHIYRNIQKISYFPFFPKKRRNTIFPDNARKIILQYFGNTIFSEHLEKQDMVLGAVDAVSDFIDSIIEEIKHCSEVIKNIFTKNL